LFERRVFFSVSSEAEPEALSLSVSVHLESVLKRCCFILLLEAAGGACTCNRLFACLQVNKHVLEETTTSLLSSKMKPSPANDD